MASPRDYKNTIVPNWCPGCGDYGIQNAISAVCAKKGWANEDITLISGIGCSSRIGGYQYCYGAHTTHGRALPFAQGIKCANKDQHMIVCSGDGDSYAIGLGHAMHAIKRNMAYLEGKKLEWSMQRSDSAKVQKVTRTAACYLLAVFITLFAFVGILSWYLNRDLQLVFTIMGFAAVGAGAFILIRYQDSTREIRQADVNRNQAITLENRVKIRYVNTKNAVDFICEKYHVRNAKELEFLYGQYQEEAREKDTFRKTSDDLDYYTQNLLQYLTRLRMYDTRVWLTHANALVDSREMVELKHELLTRRQKLRARMEYSVGSIHEMKGEALKNMSKLGNNAYQLEQIIRKIEAMNPVFK